MRQLLNRPVLTVTSALIAGLSLAFVPAPPPAEAGAARYQAATRTGEVEARMLAATVAVKSASMSGSGVVISAGGHILTAAHVAGREGDECWVTLSGGRVEPARVLSSNRETDLATIKVTCDGPLLFARLGSSAPVAAGQPVIALGHPRGFVEGPRALLRRGRIVPRPAGMPPLPGKLVTDLTLMQGDSGGPVFDLDGNLLALNVMVARGDGRTYGIHARVDRVTAPADARG